VAADATPSALGALTYSGDQAALESLDREINAAANDATKLGAIEKRLLETLRRSEITYAARQAISQRLGTVLGMGPAKTTADAFKPLPAMLLEPRDSDLARLALEPVPGDVVDGVLITALEKTTGRSRLGILDSIARRRITAAVPQLEKLLHDPDATTAAAAARVLGEIANPAAVTALQTAPNSNGSTIAKAKLAAASRLPAAAALELLQDLQRNAQDPVHRATSFRISLEVAPTTAAARIADVLGGQDWSMKQVALESLSASRAANLVPMLTGKIGSWDAPTQAAVIAALARRGERSATPVVVTAATHSDAEIRHVAIGALEFLPGTPETATLLAKIAAGSDPEDARIARLTLARLNGPEVSATILAGAERGNASTRAVYLEQLALRNMTEGLAALLKARADPDVAVRTAAVSALGDLAPATEQKALLDWTVEARDSSEQSRALRSLVNVTLRDSDIDERGGPIFAVIQTAEPELALRLLPALSRIGGSASADTAARLAIRDNAKVSEAATLALTGWTDSTALPALATVAAAAAVPASRMAALNGTLRYFARNRDPWTPDMTAVVSRLMGSTTDADTQKKLLRLLHRANDKSALALAESLEADAVLGADGKIAADVIRANLAGPPQLRGSSSSGLANIIDGKTSTRWSVPALGEEWVEVDFKRSRPVVRVTLDQTGRAAEFPEHYEVYVTDDPKQPGNALCSGAGQRNKTVIDLPAGTRGRYLIVKNTAERKEAPWAICELYVD
jgi:HEAT repeat protein